MTQVKIAPSILAADFARLGEQVQAAEAAGADWIHFDVMDGRFVPNISFGLVVLEAVRRITTLPLDVHLMIVEPEKFLGAFAKAGADGLTIHSEATPNIHRAVQQIKELGLKAGVAINPGTPVNVLEPLLPDIDLALLMTVNPGFGGQQFIPQSLKRLRALKQMRDQLNPRCLIQVDGGINLQTAPQTVAVGAEVLVAGSIIFSGDVGRNMQALRSTYAVAG